jgi:hypothetical protein
VDANLRKVQSILKQFFSKETARSDVEHKIVLSQIIELIRIGYLPKDAFASILKANELKVIWDTKTLTSAFNNYFFTGNKAKWFQFQKRRAEMASRKDLAKVATNCLIAVSFSEETGIPLTQLLKSISQTMQISKDAERNMNSALAGPKQTINMLKMLPILGVALGFLLGANPILVLFDLSFGTLFLCVGLVLFLVGNKWVKRLMSLKGM